MSPVTYLCVLVGNVDSLFYSFIVAGLKKRLIFIGSKMKKKRREGREVQLGAHELNTCFQSLVIYTLGHDQHHLDDDRGSSLGLH